MSTVIESIERRQLKRVPGFRPGDRVKVHFQVVEGTRSRTQVFEGVVLKRQGSGVRETFTVRKQSFGVGVERTFPVHSPKIERLEVAGRGDVRRAKLYYLRQRVGKRARVAERRWGIEEELVAADGDVAATDSEGVPQGEAEEATPEEESGEEPVAEAEAAADEAEGEADEPEAESGEAAPEREDEAEEVAPEAEAEETVAEEVAPEAEAEETVAEEVEPEGDAEAAEEEDGAEEESRAEETESGEGEREPEEAEPAESEPESSPRASGAAD